MNSRDNPVYGMTGLGLLHRIHILSGHGFCDGWIVTAPPCLLTHSLSHDDVSHHPLSRTQFPSCSTEGVQNGCVNMGTNMGAGRRLVC